MDGDRLTQPVFKTMERHPFDGRVQVAPTPEKPFKQL
jgi:hypothetical protein